MPSCIQKFIQSEIVNHNQNQTEGLFLGISADKVPDVPNWDQLGIFVHRVIKKLCKFVQCDNIKGESMTDFLINALNNACLNPQMCCTQTFNEAGNVEQKSRFFSLHITRT